MLATKPMHHDFIEFIDDASQSIACTASGRTPLRGISICADEQTRTALTQVSDPWKEVQDLDALEFGEILPGASRVSLISIATAKMNAAVFYQIADALESSKQALPSAFQISSLKDDEVEAIRKSLRFLGYDLHQTREGFIGRPKRPDPEALIA